MLTKLIRSTALAAVVFTASIAPSSAQSRRQQSVIVFYTDESYTVMAGQIILFCDGTRFRSGMPTMYPLETYYGCD